MIKKIHFDIKINVFQDQSLAKSDLKGIKNMI
jgi:hypothetical protein